MTILSPDGEIAAVQLFKVGEPCPDCAAQGVKSIVQGQFGGGAICMRCGRQEKP